MPITSSNGLLNNAGGSGGTPGGSNTQIQYNSSGSFAGDTGFVTDGAGSVNITGDLDVDNININGNAIISSDTNGNINLTPNGTGNLVLDGLNWPQADSTANYVLKTNGSGQISFVSQNLVQFQYGNYTTWSSTSTVMPFDDTIPQNTEGAELVTVSITPKSSSNLLIIHGYIKGYLAANLSGVGGLFQDSTADAISGACYANVGDNACLVNAIIEHVMVAGTTSSTTFKLRAGPGSAGTMYFNGSSAARRLGGVQHCRITVMEVTP